MPSAALLLALAALPPGAAAQQPPRIPTEEQIDRACATGAADTLPNPFRDVRPEHWAYKAVLNLHYCGAARSVRKTISAS
ncbi:gsl3373 [Gloeobacter violaceus PCC 7421]|uniref:Gsl3373 protein n=2 Tax=Gloeobacter violaceus TaxID=33072 RepID=Q7NG01_GLOVI|nr:gsl3373 [Gloeobacter violaceus PCC 7421]